jgi:hypothetical protein
MQMGLSVEECWLGVTANAARAIGRDDIGRLRVGARADLCVFACDDPAYVPYHYSINHLVAVIKDGSPLWLSGSGAGSGWGAAGSGAVGGGGSGAGRGPWASWSVRVRPAWVIGGGS